MILRGGEERKRRLPTHHAARGTTTSVAVEK